MFNYESADAGESWSETETITSGTASGLVNIRPIQVINSPITKPVDALWLQGEYTAPNAYNMSIICRGQGVPATAISFDTQTNYVVINGIIDLTIIFSPLFVENRNVILTSSDTSVAIITPEGKVKGVGAGSATITAKATSNNSLTATCEVVVEATPVFDVFMERIVNEAFATRISNVTALESNVSAYLAQLQSDGSFPDVNYASTDRTSWEPLVHLNRMIEMALAYTYSSSSMYGDANLKSKLDLMLQYWQSVAPTSANWYQNEIAEPQRMGLFLILMKYAGAQNVSQTLSDNAIIRLREKGGNPGAQTGANRVDVALHWMYRACLTSDRNLLQTAMDYIYSPIEYTTGSEGIQYDNSYTQHGRQLHIGSYGEVFLNGITTATTYAVGTQYALPADKLAILSKLAKDSYLSVFRGDNIFFNVIGRASTRPDATVKQGVNKIAERMAAIDATNVAVYNDANLRFTGTQPASYNVNATSTHFYNTDYTLHKRPAYSADLRMVSTRTVRNEYLSDNLEGKKKYLLSDGAMGLYVDGDEYKNIFPVWNWEKIPGVTCPEVTDIPQASTYIKSGQSDFVGGVSDSTNTVSVYKSTDTEFNINTSANKSWFFFDNEIVCLGSNVKSTATQKVNTTLNQTLLKGSVTVSVNGTPSTIANGSTTYDKTVDWVYHNGIGYYFPQKAKIDLAAQSQSGNWYDINGNNTSDVLSKEVISLSIDHGVQPTNDKYAYILVPALQDATQAQGYNVDNIEILSNSESVQAVHTNNTGVYLFVFLKPSGFKVYELIVETDAPCAVIVKNIAKGSAVVSVADPSSSANA
ncbi:MAG: polysaccharide lyase family 8 super-sandwich domain-containing protein, partial [Paludibacteraceae bacterium]